MFGTAFVLVFLHYVDGKPVELRSGHETEELCVQEGRRLESKLDVRRDVWLWTCKRD